MTLPRDVRRRGNRFRAVVSRRDGTRWTGQTRATAAEASADAISFRALHRLDRPTEVVECSLSEALALLVAELERRDARPATIRGYRQRFAVLTRPGRAWRCWSPGFAVSQLDAGQVQRWADARRRAGISASTIWGQDVALLRRLVRAALRAGRIDRDPLAALPATPFRKGRREAFVASQVRGLLEAIRSAPCRWDLRERDCAIVEFLFATGLRRAEFARLRARDADFERRIVRVDGKTSERRVPLSASGLRAAHVLLDGLAPDDAPIRSERAIELVFARISARTGIAVSPHRLRHGFASELAAAGVEPFTIARLLGHASLAMVLTYIHEVGHQSAAAVAAIDRALHG